MALRLEGGMFWSATARRIMARHWGVRIGAYSYGSCFDAGSIPAGVEIGRYVSMAWGVRVFVRNHPMDRLSLHPFFYNGDLGFVGRDNIPSGKLEVGHDAWIGERAIITPGCSRIGIGAVVGAGAVVTKDIPDFAIAAGNPARVIRLRFTTEVRDRVIASQWWRRSVYECGAFIEAMTGPLTSMHPLLAQRQADRASQAIPTAAPQRGEELTTTPGSEQ